MPRAGEIRRHTGVPPAGWERVSGITGRIRYVGAKAPELKVDNTLAEKALKRAEAAVDAAGQALTLARETAKQTGPAGRDGVDGAAGSPGEPGPPGAQGPAGVAGPAGRDGAAGQRGMRGPAGIPGLDGVGIDDVRLTEKDLTITLTDGRKFKHRIMNETRTVKQIMAGGGGKADVTTPQGTWGYASGTSGTETLTGRKQVTRISAIALEAGGTVQINGGDTITIPYGSTDSVSSAIDVPVHGVLIDPEIIFTGTDSYLVQYVARVS